MKMAYGGGMGYHLHMHLIFGGHLLNIPTFSNIQKVVFPYFVAENQLYH